jgi:hypothetical protein
MQTPDIPADSDYSVLTIPLWIVYSGWTIADIAVQPEESVMIALIRSIPAILATAACVLQAFYSIRIKREKMALERELKLKELERRFPTQE